MTGRYILPPSWQAVSPPATGDSCRRCAGRPHLAVHDSGATRVLLAHRSDCSARPVPPAATPRTPGRPLWARLRDALTRRHP